MNRSPVTTAEVKLMREIIRSGKSVMEAARVTGRCTHTVRRYLSEKTLEKEKERLRQRYLTDKANPRWLERHRRVCREYKRRVRAEGGDAT